MIRAAAPLAAVLWAASLMPRSTEAAAETHAYAVIIATNASSDGSLAPLRYADDDGVRYFELMSLIAPGRAALHSVLDAETQRLFPAAAALARAPTRDAIAGTLAATFAAIEKDQAAGLRTVLYFVYVGHGSVGADGEGAMHLADGRLTRSDLYQQVISRSPATMNHLIIDACNAYLMIARRGEGERDDAVIDDAVASFLGKEGLARYPNVGVLASTSQAAEVHEWARFAAGIFSHEVRSALAGAADVDRNGQVTYDEVRAFLAAANGRVRDPRARIAAHATPPAVHLEEPLFDRRLAAGAPILEVPSTLAGRRWLEDARGVRYADFNSASDGALTLVLVPAAEYFLRTEEEEIRIPTGALAMADASQFPREASAVSSRGAETLAFQRDLFAIPFGQAYFDGFANAPQPVAIVELPSAKEGSSVLKIIAIAAGTSALATVATGIGFGLAANGSAADYRGNIGPNVVVNAEKGDAESLARTANVLYAIGAGLATGAVLTWLLD